jgi:hypothetical protein
MILDTVVSFKIAILNYATLLHAHVKLLPEKIDITGEKQIRTYRASLLLNISLPRRMDVHLGCVSLGKKLVVS